MLKSKEILKNAKNIVVIGASNNTTKAAHRIPKYLQEVGYNVIPVNPNTNDVLALKTYKSISEIPKDIKIDIVNVFRPSKDIKALLPAILERFNNVKDIKLLWLQEGIHSKEAKELCKENDIEFIQGICIYKVHASIWVMFFCPFNPQSGFTGKFKPQVLNLGWELGKDVVKKQEDVAWE